MMSATRSVSGPTQAKSDKSIPTRLYAQRAWVADTKVTDNERLSAALVSGVVVLGFAVSILFMVWLTMFSNQPNGWINSGTIGFTEFSEADQNKATPQGFVDDWLPPGVDEMELEQPQLAESLEAVTETVSTIGGALERIDGDAPAMGGTTGLGDYRKPGLQQEADFLPEWERWRLEYSAGSKSDYIKMLGKLNVTLGAVAQLSNKIEFVNDLDKDTPAKESGSRESDQAKHLYFKTKGARLQRWEKAFLAEQGVELENRLVVHFISHENRTKLMALEREAIEAAGKSLEEVESTRFGVRAKGEDGFEFYVIEKGIKYRPAPPKKSGAESSKSPSSNSSGSKSKSEGKSG